MFHKPDSSVLVKGKKSVDVPLKKSDRKRLLQTAQQTLAIQNDESTLLHAIFMEGTLASRKILHPHLNKVVLYFRSPTLHQHDHDAPAECEWPYIQTTQCIWMTVDEGPSCSSLVHVPTVALLSVLAKLSFPTVTVPFHVSKYLCRGAHLMKAGITSLPTPTNKNGIVAIQVDGNPQPFAVGKLAHDFETNSSGVGVEIWTCFGDDLWKQQQQQQSAHHNTSFKKGGVTINPLGGSCFDDGNYGNVGFLDGKICKPIVAVQQEEHEEVAPNTDSQHLDQATATATDNGDNTVTNDEDDTNINPNDAILHQAVCEALVNIKDSQLPMTSTNFYAQHVKPRAAIQIKSTSWKKFNTYLQFQVDCGLLTCKAHNTDPMGYLVAINRRHDDLQGIQKDASVALQTKTKLAVVNLFIVPHHFIKLLRLDPDSVKADNAKSVERRGTGMLTTPEVRAILDNYISENTLALSSTQIQLDAALTSALFKKQSPPESLSKKQLYKHWLAKMEPAYALVEMPGNHISKLGRGNPPCVKLEVSIRQGRKKYATRVRGLEAYGIDPVAFCENVTRRFACSGTVETEPEGRAALKKGHVELEFQGHLVEELKALLLGDEKLTSHGGAKDSDYCLPKSAIDVVLKKNVPAKKPRQR